MKFRKILIAACLAAATFPAAAQPAPAQASHPPLCLRVRDIADTSSKDGKVLTFKMKDGTIYANHLSQNCNGLIFGGFTWVARAAEEVCEDHQTLRVMTTGEICRLGRFDPPVSRNAAAR